MPQRCVFVGSFFLKPSTILYEMRTIWLQRDGCALPRNSMSHWRDEVCLFFLEYASLALGHSWKHAWINKCYFDQPLSQRWVSLSGPWSSVAGMHLSNPSPSSWGLLQFAIISSAPRRRACSCSCLEMHQLVEWVFPFSNEVWFGLAEVAAKCCLGLQGGRWEGYSWRQ